MRLDLESIKVTFDYSNGQTEDIKRCLETLYSTAEGTVPLDRSFGLNNDFVGMPIDVAKNLIAVEITDKTDRYEPRATIKEIIFDAGEDGTLKAEVVITDG